MRTLLAILPLVLLASCLPPRMWTDFDLDFHENAVIPAGTAVGQVFDVTIDSVLTNSEDVFSFNGTGDELIEEAKLQELHVELSAPQGEDLSFLQSVQVYISTAGLSEMLLGQHTSVPSTSTMLDLQLNEADFKEYLKKDQVQLRLSVLTDEAISQDHTLHVHTSFTVHAEQHRK